MLMTFSSRYGNVGRRETRGDVESYRVDSDRRRRGGRQRGW